MKHHALKLYDYHVWANQRLFQHLKALPAEAITEQLNSVFPSVFEALVHIYTVDHVWLFTMRGDSFDKVREAVGRIPEETKGKSIEEMERLFQGASDQYQAFFGQQSDLDALKTYTHPHFGSLEARYADIVQHVVNHGTYHRGNITAMLRQQGLAGVPTDYIFYLFDGNKQ
ncbi:DinB family protein [Brevibacillus ruminantium]|uniref:DinB family protein n=1 Tax=Brevibacillus ruminantium TaxID=2950604 RepID=A0ABY4WJ46_9BACL|nr:DinB family protein [Brevibacillus ruminantium]USG66188.1 DinB family protein [Brevibacillus ruminantium]